MLTNVAIMAEDHQTLAKILLVDDEPRVLRSLKAALKNNYEIHTATDGETAKRLLNQGNNYSVIISDERMPNILGHELLIWSKKHFPQCTRILMTGYSDMNALQNSINQAEIFRYIPKPWKIQNVIEIIDHALIETNSGKYGVSEQEAYQKIKANCSLAVLETDQENSRAFEKITTEIVKSTVIYDSAEVLYQAMMQDKNIGVVIIDTSVIGVSASIAMIRQLKQTHPNVAVIVLTTAADGGSAIDMINTGQIFKYLVKPVSSIRMTPAIASAVDNYVNKTYKYDSIRKKLNGDVEVNSFKYYWRNISSLWHWNKPNNSNEPNSLTK